MGTYADNGREELAAWESIDTLLTVEMRPRGLPRGYISAFYDAVRNGGEPLVYRIARELRALEPSRFAIFTGVVLPPHLELGEVDGFPGAAILARALGRLGHAVELVVEPPQVDVARLLCEIAGAEQVEVLDGVTGRASDVQSYVEDLGAAIAIEKIGRNGQGIRHSVLGTPFTTPTEHVDDYFEAMLARGRLTVGIGDGGNEIGFGAAADRVKAILGTRSHCRCGCADGIVTATATRYLLPCAISNYGAYALATALAILTAELDLCPEPGLVGTLLAESVAAGLLDGGTLDPTFVGDDGVPVEAVKAVAQLLTTIAHQDLAVPAERPF